jgi:uncharacterized membrane protein
MLRQPVGLARGRPPVPSGACVLRAIVEAVTYNEFISGAVKVAEAIGAAIMILGGLAALVGYVVSMARSPRPSDAYRTLRMHLGRAILLGLEVLIVGDIVRTIIVEPTIESVVVLGMIVVIRIVLSFSLEVEVDGVWPWNRPRLEQPGNPADPTDGGAE